MVDIFTDIMIKLPLERVAAYAGNLDYAPINGVKR